MYNIQLNISAIKGQIEGAKLASLGVDGIMIDFPEERVASVKGSRL